MKKLMRKFVALAIIATFVLSSNGILTARDFGDSVAVSCCNDMNLNPTCIRFGSGCCIDMEMFELSQKFFALGYTVALTDGDEHAYVITPDGTYVNMHDESLSPELAAFALHSYHALRDFTGSNVVMEHCNNLESRVICCGVWMSASRTHFNTVLHRHGIIWQGTPMFCYWQHVYTIVAQAGWRCQRQVSMEVHVSRHTLCDQ
ncbi:MAG: hypothetical protein FWC93_05970 [Defluviitaleaceae bacterium]|nr:hypothetical protein [Defluviitaleaceae bacterium]